MLQAHEQALVAVAERIVRSLPVGEIHTVAAAAMDVNGDIHTGANVLHFTGGLCAELVAIGAAAGAGAEPLISIVAVADAGRKVATVRYRDPLHVGPALFVFDDGHTIRRLDGDVMHVNSRKVAQLTDEDAHREDLDNRQSLLAALTDHYADLHDDDWVDVVAFQIVKP